MHKIGKRYSHFWQLSYEIGKRLCVCFGFLPGVRLFASSPATRSGVSWGAPNDATLRGDVGGAVTNEAPLCIHGSEKHHVRCPPLRVAGKGQDAVKRILR